ncbi:MAG TPA: hypothetical protein VM055_06410 [Novosphingobium sp.]|nr:hypothetical protein [Novosphingobium sp.]
MLGPKMNTVFASRWKATWWAAGVLLTAYCSVPSPDEEASVAGPPAHSAAKNPWADDAPSFATDKNLRDFEALRHKLP